MRSKKDQQKRLKIPKNGNPSLISFAFDSFRKSLFGLHTVACIKQPVPITCRLSGNSIVAKITSGT